MTLSRTIYKAATTAHTACCAGIGALLLSSCSSPPKPPSVDESTRRPVNARAAVDLKACQGDLSRATILVSEMARAGAVGTRLNKAIPPQEPTANAADTAMDVTVSNVIAVVPFGVGSASWNIQQADADALVRRAKGAAAIMIRGRTDAVGESLQETALARRRAESAVDFLLLAGVPKNKLRLTWQGAGDPVPGLVAAERGQSRRVEIEFYTSAPVLVSVRSSGSTSISDAQGRGAARTPDPMPSAAKASVL